MDDRKVNEITQEHFSTDIGQAMYFILHEIQGQEDNSVCDTGYPVHRNESPVNFVEARLQEGKEYEKRQFSVPETKNMFGDGQPKFTSHVSSEMQQKQLPAKFALQADNAEFHSEICSGMGNTSNADNTAFQFAEPGACASDSIFSESNISLELTRKPSSFVSTFVHKLPIDRYEEEENSRICYRTDEQSSSKIKEILPNEKPIENVQKCEIDLKDFTSKSSLNIPGNIHGVEKLHVCQTCRKTFRHKHELDDHIKIHINERPFVCDICEKRFTRKPHLADHYLIHTGDKPFACDKCEKTFRRKQHLEKHLRTQICVRTVEEKFN